MWKKLKCSYVEKLFVSVCVCVCVCACMHVCVCVCMHACVCVRACTHAHMHARTHARLYVAVCMCAASLCLHACVCVRDAFKNRTTEYHKIQGVVGKDFSGSFSWSHLVNQDTCVHNIFRYDKHPDIFTFCTCLFNTCCFIVIITTNYIVRPPI